MPVPMEEYTLTVAEAAAMLGGSEKAIQRLIFTAKLDAIRVQGEHGHEFRVRPEEIRARQAELHRFVAEMNAEGDSRRRAEARPEGGPPARSDPSSGARSQTPREPASRRTGETCVPRTGESANRQAPIGPFLAFERLAAAQSEPFDEIKPATGPAPSLAAEETVVPEATATELSDTIDSLVGAVSALVDSAGGAPAKRAAPEGTGEATIHSRGVPAFGTREPTRGTTFVSASPDGPAAIEPGDGEARVADPTDAAPPILEIEEPVASAIAASPQLTATAEAAVTELEPALVAPSEATAGRSSAATVAPLESLTLEPERPWGAEPDDPEAPEPADRASAESSTTRAAGQPGDDHLAALGGAPPADAELAVAGTATITPVSPTPLPEKRGLLDRLRRLVGRGGFRF